jgi:hypothetical protein
MRRKKRKLPKTELLKQQIADWEGKQEGAVITLRRSAEKLLELRRQLRRTQNRETAAFYAEVRKVEPVEHPKVEARETKLADDLVGDGLDIPPLLDRTSSKDEAARAEIKAQQEAEKKRKAQRRIEKLKIGQEIKHAELTGQRRKMPLTGREALAAIRAK